MTMLKLLGFAAGCLVPALYACSTQDAPIRSPGPGVVSKADLLNPAPAKPALGINLSGPADWSTELPLVDLFKFSRDWISQEEGKGWGQGPALELDAQGWVRQLPPRVYAETFLTSFDRNYPAGDYVALWEGDGDLRFSGNTTVKSQTAGRMVLSVDPNRGPFSVQVRRTNPSNPLRNLRVLMPGTESTYRTNPFSEKFLNRWRGVTALRFMDWMQTNNSKVRRWADRPQLTDAHWSQRGIPAELLLDLANRLRADAWICVPHLADDDYNRSLASLVAKRLDPRLRVYVEYSNEVWNGQFEQQRYAGDQGLALGLGNQHWDAGWHFYARRSKQIFAIWSTQFSKPRLVRVMASQAGNAYVAEQILGFENAAQSADALAIAPYFSMNVPQEGDLNAAIVAGWSRDRLFQHLGEISVPEAIGWIKAHQAVAARYKLALIAYEGGQHLVGVQGGENNDALTTLLIAANQDARMGGLYDRYLTAWRQEGGGLFANFSSVSRSSKWGSWGVLETSDENPSTAPKYQSIIRWAQSLGQTIRGR